MLLSKIGYALSRPMLRAMDAEAAHRLTVRALAALPSRKPAADDPMLAMDLFGLRFSNPLGLAPGFDKNAEVPDQMLAQGLGFVEIGTVTPRPQAGNPRPRLFRLIEDEAVINRMGFNNDGAEPVLERLRVRKNKPGIVGVNIGANKDSIDRIADYENGVARFVDIASYLTVNVSSPNTPGLRALQSREELRELLTRVSHVRRRQKSSVPLLLKIAPDLSDQELRDVAEICQSEAVDGVIISNTTLSRDGLHSAHARQTGGLSGKPLFHLSTCALAKFYQYTEGRIPLVGVGGISDAETAFAKIAAGASLIQLYSALVYQGPGLIDEIKQGLARRLRQHGFASIKDAVGQQADTWAQS
jgi:dihydroorotate dehydrogenase